MQITQNTLATKTTQITQISQTAQTTNHVNHTHHQNIGWLARKKKIKVLFIKKINIIVWNIITLIYWSCKTISIESRPKVKFDFRKNSFAFVCLFNAFFFAVILSNGSLRHAICFGKYPWSIEMKYLANQKAGSNFRSNSWVINKPSAKIKSKGKSHVSHLSQILNLALKYD